MRSVSKKTGVSKKAARDKRILARAARENGAGKPLRKARKPDPDEFIAFSRGTLRSFDLQLQAAQELAIKGSISPRYLDAGPVKAVEAFQMIGHIRRDIARALVVAELEGGAL